MSRWLLRVALAPAVILAAACSSAGASPGGASDGGTVASTATAVASNGYFKSNGLYDCQTFNVINPIGAYQTYVSSYKFNPDGTYSEAGARVGHQLQPPVISGRYVVRGNRIIPTSGILKQLRDHMVIESNFLHLVRDDGRPGGLSCIRIYPAPPTPPKVTAVATFSCASTGEKTNPITNQTYYLSNLVTSTLTFFSDGTYQPNGLTPRGTWRLAAGKIVFTSGPYWQDSPTSPAHDVGILESPGVPMPHAAPPFDPSTLYTLVIKDTVAEGGIPPSQEFTNYDGPAHAPYSGQPQSFYYCKKS